MWRVTTGSTNFDNATYHDNMEQADSVPRAVVGTKVPAASCGFTGSHSRGGRHGQAYPRFVAAYLHGRVRRRRHVRRNPAPLKAAVARHRRAGVGPPCWAATGQTFAVVGGSHLSWARPDCVADDAVSCEPVSAANSNRENNRERANRPKSSVLWMRFAEAWTQSGVAVRAIKANGVQHSAALRRKPADHLHGRRRPADSPSERAILDATGEALSPAYRQRGDRPSNSAA